ncbi:MAG: serine/threonine protein kinase [Deltaproteobacteria bacterium]|nr:serine/threonine protein kinase [Deltaproteobacteria bacterium]
MADTTADEDVTPEAIAALGDVRPPIDRVRMEAARARAEQALFAVDAPARVGRYVVLDTAGRGGMGVVYRAYDPQLDRKVALKVVSARGAAVTEARERLLGEARALAQLAHPNVVPVHDAILLGDDVVVVMELVDGITLAAWGRSAARRTAEIVAIFAQAARGLAAAHDVGVIHRDFKPANALVGVDGRVRVVDFGLARFAAGDADGDGGVPRSRVLTAAGAIVGTPAYMAPEQLTAGEITAAADQFSFWVSLYEAIAGVRPFDAEDRDGMLAAIRAGKLAAPREGRTVPGWLRQLVQRGLAVDPAARLPSMHAVASELTRARGWRRARGPAALGALATIATVATLAVLSRSTASDPIAACDGGAAEIDRAWSAADRTRLQTSFAQMATPYAREVEGLVLGGLDRYRASWSAQHRAACEAHRHGAMTPLVLDRSMACLQRRADDLRAAVQVLGEMDAPAIGKAVDVVVRLAPTDACGDRESLATAAPLIAEPARRTEVAAARARLARAAALDAAGRAAEAMTEARAVVAIAERLEYPPLVIEAELLIGRTRLFAGEFEQALAPLGHAEEVALANQQIADAVVAGARRIFAEGMLGHDVSGLERQFAVLEPLSRSVARDPLARPLLLNNIGNVHLAGARRDLAVRDFQAAQAAMAGLPRPDPELNHIAMNLAMLTADPVERERLARAGWQATRASFGPSHLQSLVAQQSLSLDLVSQPESLAMMADACDRYTRDHPELVVARVGCTYSRALFAAGAGDDAEAVRRYRELVAIVGADVTDDVADLTFLAAGEVALADRDLATAQTQFERALKSLGPELPWYALEDASHAHMGLARCALARGDRRAARAQLDQAIAQLDQFLPHVERVRPRLTRARAIALRDEASARP